MAMGEKKKAKWTGEQKLNFFFFFTRKLRADKIGLQNYYPGITDYLMTIKYLISHVPQVSFKLKSGNVKSGLCCRQPDGCLWDRRLNTSFNFNKFLQTRKKKLLPSKMGESESDRSGIQGLVKTSLKAIKSQIKWSLKIEGALLCMNQTYSYFLKLRGKEGFGV